MSESGDSSSKGSTASGGSSVVSDNSDARALGALQDKDGGDESINDLLEQNKNLEESAFAGLYTLTKNRQCTSYRMTAFRIVLEFLQMFRVVFNSSFAWHIQKDLWIWQGIRWVLFRMLVWETSYELYISIFYLLAAIILTSVVVTLWVAWLMKKDENGSPWIKRLVWVCQMVAFVMYSLFWVAVLDYMVYLFDCDWEHISNPVHVHWTDQSCLAMPHMAHMFFAAFVVVVFCTVTLCLSFSDCDSNPLSRNLLGSPVPVASFKLLAFKIVMVLASTVLDSVPSVQPVIMLICSAIVIYYLLSSVLYYYDWINHIWVGLWFGILFTCALLLGVVYSTDQSVENRAAMTMAVLYGIFPSVLLGVAASWFNVRWARRPQDLIKACYQDPSYTTHLKDVYRFRDVDQVEVLSRAMRVWDKEGVPDPEAAAFGEYVLKCGMARFNNNPTMHTMYANFLLEAHKDGQAARTQLQLAIKSSPSLVERYYIYVCQELAKRLKTDGDGGLDLMGYVEFQRNYRACVKAHKLALQAQRLFWHTVLRDSVAFKDLQRCFEMLDTTEKQASQVYRRVMERYPNNGKLLRIYGRFTEYVRNDPWRANRYYTEATKQCAQDSLLSLTGGKDGDNSKLVAVMGPIDEKVDGVVIINAEGTILMVSQAAQRMWGYEKGELEGKNVAVLMPQPFSMKHNSFLQHYTTTGEARILDTVRNVIALNKDRTVFPVNLCVTKLSGTGADAIFMGVIKAATTDDPAVVKLWCTPTGIVMCCDARLSDLFGNSAEELIGRPITCMATDLEAVEKFVTNCSNLPEAEVSNGALKLQTSFMHKFLASVDVEITAEFGGTQDQRIFMFCIRCLTDASALMVVDYKGRIAYATSQLGTMLGHPVSTLQDMTLSQLIPAPFAQLHGGWMKDLSARPGPCSCRSGAVVHLMSAKGQKVPATLQLSEREDGDHMNHIVQVTKCTMSDPLDLKRITVAVNNSGRVLSVSTGAGRGLFGFQPSDLMGISLANFINVFASWRVRHGNEEGLLLLLNTRAEQTPGKSWRVGIHAPVTDEEVADRMMTNPEGPDATHSTFNAFNARRRERPAIMTVDPVIASDDASAVVSAEDTAVLHLHLWRADILSTVLEVDSKLQISKVDEAAGLLFGVPYKTLHHQSLNSLLKLPAGTTSQRLLSAGALDGDGYSAAKGAMKGSKVHKVGPVRIAELLHRDGGPLKLQFQPVSKEAGSGTAKLLVTLHLVEPSAGKFRPFLGMRASQVDIAPEALVVVPRPGGAALDADSFGSEDAEELGSDAGGAEAGPRYGSPTDLHKRLDSRLRSVAEWVKGSVKASEAADDGDPLDDLYPERVYPPEQGTVAINIKGRPPKEGMALKEGWALKNARAHNSPTAAAVDRMSDGGSEASGVGPSASEAGDGSSAVGSQEAGDDDLVSDWRRAKRLKKLNRLMTSSAAQTASDRFKRQTLMLVLTVLLAHIVCFVILITQIDARYTNSYEVQIMARAADRGQLLVLRTELMQQCQVPMYAAMETCSPATFQNYHNLLRTNTHIMRESHQGLYLGVTGLKGFSDARLANNWTFEKLTEQNYLEPTRETPQGSYYSDNRTLWEIGNRYAAAADEVYFWAGSKSDGKLGEDIQDTRAWQYICNNGRESLFDGYSWSLDVMVEFTWVQLGGLSTLLIILLVLEALLVQLICMGWEFVLLKLCNLQHMKRFSVFLALPSGTIRSMTSRPCVVDDDDKSDLDEDELDVGGDVGGDAARQSSGGDQLAKETKKGVRISVTGAVDDDTDGRGKPVKKTAKGKQSKKNAQAIKAAAKAAKQSSWSYIMYKKLFGWATMNYKINGKKLVPNNLIVWRFMVPMALWVAGVIIIFGVSFQQLSDLQGPLASLNVASHVMYRVARVRSMLSLFAFAQDHNQVLAYRKDLLDELGQLRSEYDTLLYGGKVQTVAKVSFDFIAPAGAFSSPQAASLFFKTTDCLRQDQSGCFKVGSKYYDVTHHGLDAIMLRYMDDVKAFAMLPDDMASPNNTLYMDATALAPNDMYDGLSTASDMFVQHTIDRFEQVKMLHIILLVVTLVLVLGFLTLLYRPYCLRLHSESKTMAGLLSQLPAEVDVEGLVKTTVLGIVKGDGNTSVRGGLPGVLPGMPGGTMVPGMAQPPFQAPAPSGFGLKRWSSNGAQQQPLLTPQQQLALMQQQQHAIDMGPRNGRGWARDEDGEEEQEEEEEQGSEYQAASE